MTYGAQGLAHNNRKRLTQRINYAVNPSQKTAFYRAASLALRAF